MSRLGGAVIVEAYVGVGTNLGDRDYQLRRAQALLQAAGVQVSARSPVYETEPWGVRDQPRFLNAVWRAHTSLAPLALLRALKEIERAMGRQPTVRYGPRVIDLDLLLYDDLVLRTPELQVPHPGLTNRAFVLVPLADLAPLLRHPETGLTIAEHLAALGPPEGIAAYPPGLPQPAEAEH